MNEKYDTIRFCCASQFLEAIRPSHPRWLPENSRRSPWVFRGHGNSEWILSPASWRESVNNNPRFKDAYESVTEDDIKNVCDCYNLHAPPKGLHFLIALQRFEFLQIQSFVELSDELGMHIPGGFPELSLSHDFFNVNTPIDTPPHQATALAQHHGMVTRLLDWTLNPLAAAFFASETPDEPDGAIAIWALNRIFFHRCKDWCEFKVPRSQIGYLHAQAGMFSYHRQSEKYYIDFGCWPSLEEQCNPQLLKKLILPASESEELQRLLFVEGISKVHLMPTFDNIKNTLSTNWYN